MEIEEINSKATRLSIQEENKEIARCFVFFITNNLHERPYALIEDVFVEEKFRSQGLGTKLIQGAVEIAREKGCYKIIATSRNERVLVHNLYKKLGFSEHGKEFRIDIK
jgi:GNAT superfamily N-acetyltransferase